jgi:hypothetical protein
MQHIISVGGGLTSTLYTTEAVLKFVPKSDVRLIMAKLPNEDPDVWRLCDAVSSAFGVTIEYIGLGLTPWDIFFKEKAIGNSLIDPCSKKLKRQVLTKWLYTNCDKENTILHVGITKHEIDRMVALTANYRKDGWTVDAPLYNFDMPREEQMKDCENRFGFVPRLYKYGFHHNNCGGACIKAGMKEWGRLLYYLPDVYHWWEFNETKFRNTIGKDYTVLHEVKKGVKQNLTLYNYRRRCERWWGSLNIEKGTVPYDSLARVKDLPDNPPCMWCSAV